ncbi:MAG: hypothetical protein AB7R69_06160 [Candidatus Babeliales bacterium]
MKIVRFLTYIAILAPVFLAYSQDRGKSFFERLSTFFEEDDQRPDMKEERIPDRPIELTDLEPDQIGVLLKIKSDQEKKPLLPPKKPVTSHRSKHSKHFDTIPTKEEFEKFLREEEEKKKEKSSLLQEKVKPEEQRNSSIPYNNIPTLQEAFIALNNFHPTKTVVEKKTITVINYTPLAVYLNITDYNQAPQVYEIPGNSQKELTLQFYTTNKDFDFKLYGSQEQLFAKKSTATKNAQISKRVNTIYIFVDNGKISIQADFKTNNQ